MNARPKTILLWIAQIAVAALFVMAAVPKLTGDPMAAAMVEQLGVGAWAGPVIGLFELTAAILLLIPRTAVYGGLVGVLILLGAIVSHLTVLGISMGEEDGGSMFMMAVVGLLLSGTVAYFRRTELCACHSRKPE